MTLRECWQKAENYVFCDLNEKDVIEMCEDRGIHTTDRTGKPIDPGYYAEKLIAALANEFYDASLSANEDVELCTFAEDDDDYCRYFVVPRKWLVEELKKAGLLKRPAGLAAFLDQYDWSATWHIYQAALQAGQVKEEQIIH